MTVLFHLFLRYNIWANRYMVDAGWSKAQWIDAPNTMEAHAPQVSLDVQGNAMAVWQHKEGQRTRIAADRYGGWRWLGPGSAD